MGAMRGPGSGSLTTAKSDINLQNADGNPKGANGSASGASNENTLFNKHYNKELKLCEGKYLIILCLNEMLLERIDEIPIVLCELNESALAYLGRDQFENALLLLQKAHGVLDAVDLSGSKRDQYIAL